MEFSNYFLKAFLHLATFLAKYQTLTNPPQESIYQQQVVTTPGERRYGWSVVILGRQMVSRAWLGLIIKLSNEASAQ